MLARFPLVLSACLIAAMVLGTLPASAVSVPGATLASSTDPTPPIVELWAPEEGAVLGGVEGLVAGAYDPESGVNKVEFLVDGTAVGEEVIEDGGGFEEREFTVYWNSSTVGNGTHTVTARAFTRGTPSTTSTTSHSVTVDNVFFFAGPSKFGAGDWPYALASSDLNGDGSPDLATTNVFSDDVSILLGNGDGTFRAAVGYPVGDGPVSIVIVDLNGDGKADLATANEFSDEVSILLGNGDGTFQTAVNYAAGDGSRTLVAADFNRDGESDLATANGNAGGVSILRGNGDGTFQTATHYPAGASSFALAAADLNGDGEPDLATADPFSYVISVLLGNGDGSFQAAVGYPSGGASPRAVAAADVNADGQADLAIANIGTGDVSILLGNGDGTFAPAVLYETASPSAITFADLNGDGREDLLTAINGIGGVSILGGNVGGTFAAPVRYTTGGVEGSSDSVAAADLNGDGRPDLVTGNSSFDGVSVWLNTAGSPLSAPPAMPQPPPAVQDTAPPELAVTIAGRQALARALRRGIRAAVTCSEACSIVAQLRIARKLAKKLRLPLVVGKASTPLIAPGPTAVVVKFRAKAKRKLATRQALRLTLRVIATDAVGNARTINRRVALRR